MKVKLNKGKVIDGKKAKPGDTVEVEKNHGRRMIAMGSAEPVDAEAKKAAAGDAKGDG